MPCLHAGAIEARFVVSLLSELRIDGVTTKRCGGSVASLRSVMTRSVGKMMHLEIKYLVLQDWLRTKSIALYFLPGEDNTADLLTKTVTGARFIKLCKQVGLATMQKLHFFVA